MTHFRIESGEFIKLRGRPYRIGQRLEGGGYLIQPLGGETGSLMLTRAELEANYNEGHVEFLVQQWDKESSAARPIVKHSDLTQLPEKLKQIVERRHAYVTACRQVDDLRWDPRLIGPMLQATAEAVGDAKPPHPQTVRRWYHSYMNADGDARALLPSFESRGAAERRLDPDVISVIEAMIERYYLSPERHSGEHVLHMAIAAIDRLNAKRDATRQLKHPSRRTVYNEIQKLDPYAVHAARYGQRAAERKFAQTGRGSRPRRPLERVEIDHTKSDLLVVDESLKLPIGRPWITAAIDVYTRMLVGIHVGFTPPSFVSVMRCLRHGILPKTSLRQEYPEIENEWPVHGLMEGVVCDNGKEFHSNAFEAAMQQLGIEIMYCSVMDPNQKAPIERFLGTVNRGLLQHQPGSTFSDIFDRGDYDPAKNAVITFRMFKAILLKWICDVYHVRFHRGLAGVPLKVYLRAAAALPAPALPRSTDDLVVLFGRTEERVIQHSGIEFKGLFFNAPELATIRRQLGGRKAVFRLDEEDLGEAHIYDPLNRRYVRVACTEPEYAKGLSLWQHRVIRRHARTLALGEQDISALARAKADIQEMVEGTWLKSSKTASRQRMARWLGVGHGAHVEPLREPSEPQTIGESRNAPGTGIDPALITELMQRGAESWSVEQGPNH